MGVQSDLARSPHGRRGQQRDVVNDEPGGGRLLARLHRELRTPTSPRTSQDAGAEQAGDAESVTPTRSAQARRVTFYTGSTASSLSGAGHRQDQFVKLCDFAPRGASDPDALIDQATSLPSPLPPRRRRRCLGYRRSASVPGRGRRLGCKAATSRYDLRVSRIGAPAHA